MSETDIEVLTKREKEIMHFIANGKSYKSIADTLLISNETVKKHLRNIYRKLNVCNKIEAINALAR